MRSNGSSGRSNAEEQFATHFHRTTIDQAETWPPNVCLHLESSNLNNTGTFAEKFLLSTKNIFELIFEGVDVIVICNMIVMTNWSGKIGQSIIEFSKISMK